MESGPLPSMVQSAVMEDKVLHSKICFVYFSFYEAQFHYVIQPGHLLPMTFLPQPFWGVLGLEACTTTSGLQDLFCLEVTNSVVQLLSLSFSITLQVYKKKSQRRQEVCGRMSIHNLSCSGAGVISITDSLGGRMIMVIKLSDKGGNIQWCKEFPIMKSTNF